MSRSAVSGSAWSEASGPWVPDISLAHGQARGQARNSGMTAKAARGTIYKGMADYVVIQALALIALLLFLQIALWLPNVVR